MSGYVNSFVRGVSLLVLLLCCTYPLWSFLVTREHVSPLILGPFVINIISLIGENSFESYAIDWRVLVCNFVAAGFFSFASLVDVGFQSPAAGIIGIATIASMFGSLSRYEVNQRFMKQIDRRVTGAKVLILSLLAAVIVWGVTLKFSGEWTKLISVQILLAVPVVLGCVFTLLFPHGPREGDVGVGNPLLWIAARLLMAGAASGYWIWFFFSIFCFLVLQIGRDRSLIPGLYHFIRGVQFAELRYSSITLTLAVYQLVLTLQSPLCTVCTTEREQFSGIWTEISRLQNIFRDGLSSCVSPTFWWRGVAMGNASYYLEQPASFWEKLAGKSECTTHYMFEQTGSIIVMILLLTCSLMYTLRRIKGIDGDQGFWQPVFFISSAVISSLYPRSIEEVWAQGFDTRSVEWSSEAIASIGISVFGACFSLFFALFRLRGHKMIRLVNDNDISVIEGVGTLIGENFLCLILLMYVVIMSWFAIFNVLPGGKGYGEEVGFNSTGVTFPVNGSKDIYEFLYPFYSEVKNVISLFDPSSNCTDLLSCRDSIIAFENLLPGNCSMNFSIARAEELLLLPSNYYVFRFGMADLLKDELWICGFLSLVNLLLVGISIWLPIFEDMALAITLATGAVLAVAIPFKLSELHEFKNLGDDPEWQVATICIALVVICGLLFHIRIRRTISFLYPFSDVEEMRDNYEEGDLSIIEFINKYCPHLPVADVEYTWEALFQEMKNNAMSKTKLTPHAADSELASYTSLYAPTAQSQTSTVSVEEEKPKSSGKYVNV